MIPIYIPSYNRAESITTTKWLDKDNIPYKVLLHTQKCKKEYLKSGIVKEENIIVTNTEKGITNQRNWIINNLAEKGSWYISFDDNIRTFKRVVDKYYFNKKRLDVKSKEITQKSFNKNITAKEYLELLEKDIKVAESIKAEYIGYATVDNYFFNSKKYKSVGYVISKAVAIKYEGLTYDKNVEAMEDFCYCAEQLIKNNCVLINAWIKPQAGHYEKGGIGTYDERVGRKIIDCKYLMRKYPDFFRYKKKKGCHPKAELQIRFNKPKQIIEWKKSNYNKYNTIQRLEKSVTT
tara:strand:- start:248 stop:1123 length:876 start_codon:yes stop_codon:yes gene_type:complete